MIADHEGAPGERAGDVRPPPFSILLADAEADAHSALLPGRGRRYSVDAVRDPRQVVQRAGWAQAGGRPYDLVILSLAGLNGDSAGTLQQLKLTAPASTVLALAAPGSGGATAAQQRGVRVLNLPLDAGEVDRVVGALADRKRNRISAAEGELLRSIAVTGRQLLAQPTLEAGLKTLFARLAAQIGAASLMVALYDARANALQFPLVYNHGEYLKPAPRPYSADGLPEWVIANNKPIISGDLPADALRNGWKLPSGGRPARSALMLPLAVGGQVFGVIAAQSERKNAFPPDAIVLFTAASDSAAAAIANWQLREQRDLEEAVLADYDRQLATTNSREVILRSSAAAAAQLTFADGAAAVPLEAGAPEPGGTIYDTRGVEPSPALRSLLGEGGKGATRSAGPGGVMSAPITRGFGQPDAMLVVASDGQRIFGAHDRSLLEAVGRRAAGALERVESTVGRERERTALGRIAHRCAVERDLSLMLSSTLTELRKLVPWDSASVWHMDGANGGLRPLKIEGQAEHDYSTVITPGQGQIGQAAQSGTIQRARDGERGGAPGVPAIAVPLWGREGRPAVLLLQRVRGGVPFSDDEERMLVAAGELLAGGIDKSWWHESAELSRRLGTLLTTAGQDTWTAALQTIRDCMPEGACALLVADGGSGLKVLTALGSPQLTADTAWLEDESGLLSGLAAGQALLLEEAGNGIDSTGHGAGSLVAAPFTSGGRVFGALVAWSPRPRRMGERELFLLRRGAEQIAIALFASKESQRADDADRLVHILRDIQGQTDFGFDAASVLKKVLVHALQNTPAASGAVLLREPGDILVQRVQLPESATPERMLRVPFGQGAVGQVARSGELIYLPNVGQSAGVGGEHGSLVAVPVLAAGTTIGVLTVGNPQSNAFSEKDIALLRLLAGQASALLDGSGRQDALKQLRGLSHFNVSPARLLAQVPVLVAETLHAPAATVHVLDRRTNTYVLAGAAGVDAASRGPLREIPGELPSLRSLFEREGKGEGPLQVATTDPYAQAAYWHAPESRAAGFERVLAAPISLGGLPYSVVSVYAGAGRTFSVAESSVLAALCEQLGQTLQVLHQEYRYGAIAGLSDKLAPLLEADEEFQARALFGATPAALEAVVRNAVDLADARCGYILIRNDAAQRLEPRVIVGGVRAEALRWPLDGIRDTGYGIRDTGAGDTAQEGEQDPSLPHHASRIPYPVADAATHSQLLVPIVVAGAAGRQTLGLLGVESPAENAFTAGDARLLRTLASSAAMLLANAGLYARARGQEQQLQGLLAAMSTMLADLDVTRLQQRLATAARQALAADLAIVYRQAPGAAPTPPAQDGARDAESLNGDIVWHATARKVMADSAAREGTPYFVERLSDDDPGALTNREGIRAMAVIPLVGDGQVVGVLYAAYRRPIKFGPAARRYLSAFASIAALALRNGATHRSLENAMTQQMQSLSLASHELKEPVDTARMIVETALNGLWQPIGEQLRERLGVVYSLLDSHYGVLTQILQLGKLSAGAQKLLHEPVQIGDLLSDLLGNFLSVANEQGINLSASLDPALAATPVVADASLLKTAIGNLLQNALKFTLDGGKVVVTALIDRQKNPSGELVILVDDTGAGIPADKLENIFIPYFQVDQSLSRAQGGIGLGLSLAKLIVEQHGGTITAESEEGRGSRFIIRLPLGGGS